MRTFFGVLFDGERVLIAIPLPTKIAPAMTMNVVVSIAVLRIRLLSVDMNVFCILAQTENVKTVTVADFQKKKKNEPRREGGRVKVLVACEFSGIVRDAFTRKGHYAISCDILPSESEGFHVQDDVLKVIDSSFDLMIAHPPCTYLAVSGARWFKNRKLQQEEALRFVECLMDAPIEKIAIENPISIISSRIRKPDQIIQPWQFGHGETKATCLWLKNLPLLKPTNVVEGRTPRVHHASPGPDRWKERSRTLPGIAEAMAEQWG